MVFCFGSTHHLAHVRWIAVYSSTSCPFSAMSNVRAIGYKPTNEQDETEIRMHVSTELCMDDTGTVNLKVERKDSQGNIEMVCTECIMELIWASTERKMEHRKPTLRGRILHITTTTTTST
jgi:hypothetical protein